MYQGISDNNNYNLNDEEIVVYLKLGFVFNYYKDYSILLIRIS